MIDCEKLFNQVKPTILAREMGIPTTSAFNWKQKGTIPVWREHSIKKALLKLGVDISTCLKDSK